MWLEPAYRPSVDDPAHKGLESRVIQYLTDSGFECSEATYHSVMPKSIVQRIQSRYSLTALYLRGRSDRIAVHKVNGIEFEWEAKTHANPRYNDLTVEVLPLIHHIHKSELGVKCLYVFVVNGKNGGFWADAIPAIREIRVPPNARYSSVVRDSIKMFCRSTFPNCRINEGEIRGGSGDPFVIIDQSVIAKLPDWHSLIDGVIHAQDNRLQSFSY